VSGDDGLVAATDRQALTYVCPRLGSLVLRARLLVTLLSGEVHRGFSTRERVRLSCNSLQRRTLRCVTYTQRLLNKIPPPTLPLFINLCAIAAIAIMGLALVAH